MSTWVWSRPAALHSAHALSHAPSDVHPVALPPAHTIVFLARLLPETLREAFALWQMTTEDFQPLVGVLLDGDWARVTSAVGKGSLASPLFSANPQQEPGVLSTLRAGPALGRGDLPESWAWPWAPRLSQSVLSHHLGSGHADLLLTLPLQPAESR